MICMEKILYGITIEELKIVVSELLNKSIDKLINKNSSPVAPVFITRKEAANILKISLPTLDEWTKRGFIKAYRIGNGKRYIMEEVYKSLKEVKVLALF